MEPRELCTLAIIGSEALVVARHLAELTWAVGLPATLERRFPALWDETFSAAQLSFGERPAAYPVRPLDVLICLNRSFVATAFFTVDPATVLVYDPDYGAPEGEFAASYAVPLRRLAIECGDTGHVDAVTLGALLGLFGSPALAARSLLTGQMQRPGVAGCPALHGQLAGLRYVNHTFATSTPWRLPALEQRRNVMAA